VSMPELLAELMAELVAATGAAATTCVLVEALIGQLEEMRPRSVDEETDKDAPRPL